MYPRMIQHSRRSVRQSAMLGSFASKREMIAHEASFWETASSGLPEITRMYARLSFAIEEIFEPFAVAGLEPCQLVALHNGGSHVLGSKADLAAKGVEETKFAFGRNEPLSIGDAPVCDSSDVSRLTWRSRSATA